MACALGMLAGRAAAQSVQRPFVLEWADGSRDTVAVSVEMGYAAVPVDLLERLGWQLRTRGLLTAAGGPEGVVVVMRPSAPVIRWGEEFVQLAEAPYLADGRLWVPLQLLVDELPRRYPDLYAYDPEGGTLQAADPSDVRAGAAVPAVQGMEESGAADAPPPGVRDQPGGEKAAPEEERPAEVPATPQPPREPITKLVIIDAGHGGGDPGAMGRGGVREKDVALGIARIMADLLRREPGIEVRLTRDDDSFVPIWDRGELATRWKGDRPAVFVSIHANSLPGRRSAQGFETYFLSEARTDHERRVAAIENAPMQLQDQSVDPTEEPDLGFILGDLRNLDHQHWSALLAEFVQEELGEFHPGPNRGVKQAPLAVLTNALMPAVLVEVGFISNEEEALLLSQKEFQDEAARAIARAVLRFFQRYPPGSEGAGASAAREGGVVQG